MNEQKISPIADVNSGSSEEFRTRVRQFVTDNAPQPNRHASERVPESTTEETALRAWYAGLFTEQMLGGGWPVEHGGDPSHQTFHDTILMEELIRAKAPRPLDQTLLAAHVLISFGTTLQKERYLPRIRSAQDVWCQLFSEPGVGSDLAALSTRAQPLADGSGFRIDGQKVWTTDAQWSQMGVLLARTDPDARLQDGITAFVLPMDLPGVDVRPLREITGESDFCEVFLDGVEVPQELVLGEVNRGWRVVTSGLASERGYVGANAVQLEVMHADLVGLARLVMIDGRPALTHPDVRQRLASLMASVEAVRTTSLIATGDGNEMNGAGALAAKLTYTDLYVRLAQEAQELLASGQGRGAGFAALRDEWMKSLLWSRALTISGGSNEIIRSLIAQQMLGLPRSWRRAEK